MEELKPGPLLVLAGFGVMASGLTTFVAGAQLVLMFSFGSILVAFWPYLSIAVGGGTVWLGANLTRGRDWAAVGALASGLFLSLAWLIWVAYAAVNGLFTLVTVVGMLLAMVTSVMVPFTLKQARALSVARREIVGDLDL